MCHPLLPECEVIEHIQKDVVNEDDDEGWNEGADQGAITPKGFFVLAQLLSDGV